MTGRSIGARWLLLGGSLFVALAVCELVLRVAGDRLVSRASSAGSFAIAARYVKTFPVAPGVDPAWFFEHVPDVPNRRPVDPHLADVMQDYANRGIYGPNSYFVFNRVFIEQEACSERVFEKFPPTILVFDSPTKSPFPRYRFLAGRTLPSGLVTNAFGWRGAEIPLQKPPNTIRLAFVGASTTLENPGYVHSYPELVGFWLNRYFAGRHEGINVDVINAGRDGIGSTDIEAIVRYEVSPLEPDIVLYYEGANQFNVTAMVKIRGTFSPRKPESIPDPPSVSASREGGSAVVRLLQRARANRLDRRAEPPKPDHDIVWPPQLSESAPDLSRTDLPLHLSTVIRDLDSIRVVLSTLDAILAPSSFVWLSEDGMVLSATNHRFIYNQLNGTFWPTRYRDVRRFADFQNRVLMEYARSREVPFVDVAASMPRDPDLFVDAVHTTEEGTRLRAWIVLQSLLSLIQREVDAGRLPRGARAHLERHPWLSDPRPMALDCRQKAETK